MMQQPIFIIGNPRSGTTLLRLMLNCHSSIVIPPECGFLLWWKTHYSMWQWKTEQTLIADYIRHVKTSKKIETWRLDYEELRRVILQQQPDNYSELCSCIYLTYALQKGKDVTRWGDKNNYYLHHLDELQELYPQAQYIHIIRDGRDVMCSYRETQQISPAYVYRPQLPQDTRSIAQEWTNNNRKVLNFFEGLPPTQYLTLRFEDLICQPTRELQRICCFLNFPFERRMLNYDVYNRKFHEEPVELLEWKHKTLQPPDKSTIKKHKTLLTPAEIRLFEFLAGDLLQTYYHEE